MTRARLAVALLALLSSRAPAQEWARFRGLNGAGQSDATTIPASWSDSDYNWHVKLPGIGHSSPVLWGKKIFLTSADPDGNQRWLLCLSTETGKTLWIKPFDSSRHQIHLQNSFASSTPTVDEERVYILWGSPESYSVIALNHEGHEKWKKDLGPFQAEHGFGTSPIVFEDLVVVNNDQDGTSSLVALDSKTGDIRWKIPRSTARVAYSTPCVFQPKGRPPELIFASQAHGVSGVDPKSGSTKWEIPVFEKRTVGSPIVCGDLILASCGEGAGNNTMVAVRPGSKDQKPEVAYQIDKSSAPYVPTMVAHGPLVFLWGDKGFVTCIDSKSGKVHWRERVGGNYSGSPIRVGDRLYCISMDGDVVVIAASDKYELISQQSLGESSRSTPAVADGRMYLRTQSQLFSLGK
jgi:outer membrane protein assembly factor BamB